MAKTHRRTVQTNLVCECGEIQVIRRIKGRQRPDGHAKHLWCIRCKRRTPHTEIKHEWGLKELGEA